MIEIYSKNVTVSCGSDIPLTNVALIKGRTVINSGASTISFNKCGVYEVIVSATVAEKGGACVLDAETPATPKASADIKIQLFKNNVAVPQATSSTAETGSESALSFATLVQVKDDNCRCKCCEAPTNITIKNVGNETTYENIDVVVTKIC